MKYLLMGLLGGVCGTAVALGILHVNPFVSAGRPLSSESEWTLHYTIPDPDPAVYTDGGQLRLPHRPEGVAELWEETIRRTGVGLYALRANDDPSPSIAASRISLPHAASDLAVDGPLLTDYWLLTVPGQGVFFVQQNTNLWRFLRNVWLPVRVLQRPWQGPARELATPLWAAPQSVGLVGVNGIYTARRGITSVRYEVMDFTPGQERVRGELSLVWDEPRSTESSVEVAREEL